MVTRFFSSLALSVAASVALTGETVQRPAATIVGVQAAARAVATPDRLYVAVDVATEGGAPASSTVTPLDVARALARIESAGVPASAVVRHIVTPVQALWLRDEPDISNRPYGVILLRFEHPAPGQLQKIRDTILRDAFRDNLRDGVYAEAGGAWYELDDCNSVQNASRNAAMQLARDAAVRLAAAAGYVLDAAHLKSQPLPEGDSHDPGRAESAFLCGAATLPDLPPAGVEPVLGETELRGYVDDETSISTYWPALELAHPDEIPVPPATLTSFRTMESTPRQPLQDGTLAISVSLAASDVPSRHGCPDDVALPYALGLALQRAHLLGSLVGLNPVQPVALVDPAVHRARCSAPDVALGPPSVGVIETFSASGGGHAPVRRRLVSEGRTWIAVPADRARIVAHFLPGPGITSLPAAGDIQRELGAAGLDAASIRIASSATEVEAHGFLLHPNRPAMARIATVLDSLAAASKAQLTRSVDYAVDDCYALDERVLRSAVLTANARAKLQTSEQHVHLGHVIAVQDEGIEPERNCGPRVLEKLPLAVVPPTTAVTPVTATPAPFADPLAYASGSVKLVYRIDDLHSGH